MQWQQRCLLLYLFSGDFWKRSSIKTRDPKESHPTGGARASYWPVPLKLLFFLYLCSTSNVKAGELRGQKTGYKPREPSPSGPQGEEEQRGKFRIQVPKIPCLCPVLAPGKGPVVQVSHCSPKNGSPQRLASVPGRVFTLQPAWHTITWQLWNESIVRTLPLPLDLKSS